MRTYPDIRVADLNQPVGHLEVNATRRIAIRRADLGTFQLAQELAEKPDNLGLQLACLKRILPDATDEELRAFTPEVITAVVNRALANLDEVQRALGESSGVSPSTNDSPPATPTPTSATASPSDTG